VLGEGEGKDEVWTRSMTGEEIKATKLVGRLRWVGSRSLSLSTPRSLFRVFSFSRLFFFFLAFLSSSKKKQKTHLLFSFFFFFFSCFFFNNIKKKT